MSEQHSTPEEQKAFQDAIAAATGQRTAADNAATAASLDQALADVRQLKATALADPTHDYHRAPASFWQSLEQPVIAARVRHGLAPEPQPKTPHQLASELTQRSFPMPDQIHPNMQAALDARLEPLAGDRVAREEATAALKRELTLTGYNALVQDAKLYKNALTDAEKADRITLQTYASQGRRNQYKRTGKAG
jgi:hypothetical protein